MSEELKPCPFCGSRAEVYQNEVSKLYHVDCLSSDSDFDHETNPDGCPVEPVTDPYKTEAEAVKEWNTRPIEDDLRRQLDEAQEKIERLRGFVEYTLAHLTNTCNAGVVLVNITPAMLKQEAEDVLKDTNP